MPLEYVQPDLSFVDIEGIPLSQNALYQHTTKFEATLIPPSPLFRDNSLSPVPSFTSASSDESSSDYFLIPAQPPTKRIRTQPPAKLSSGAVLKSIKPAPSLLPAGAQRKGASSSHQIQPRRYRAILPAPPRSERQPSGPTLQPRSIAPGPLVGKPQQVHRSKVGSRPFQHSPTNLPPMRYPKGQDTPFRPERLEGTIPGSMLETVRPIQNFICA